MVLSFLWLLSEKVGELWWWESWQAVGPKGDGGCLWGLGSAPKKSPDGRDSDLNVNKLAK